MSVSLARAAGLGAFAEVTAALFTEQPALQGMCDPSILADVHALLLPCGLAMVHICLTHQPKFYVSQEGFRRCSAFLLRRPLTANRVQPCRSISQSRGGLTIRKLSLSTPPTAVGLPRKSIDFPVILHNPRPMPARCFAGAPDEPCGWAMWFRFMCHICFVPHTSVDKNTCVSSPALFFFPCGLFCLRLRRTMGKGFRLFLFFYSNRRLVPTH